MYHIETLIHRFMRYLVLATCNPIKATVHWWQTVKNFMYLGCVFYSIFINIVGPEVSGFSILCAVTDLG